MPTPIRQRKKLSKRLRRARWYLLPSICPAHGPDIPPPPNRPPQAAARAALGAPRRLGIPPGRPGPLYDEEEPRQSLPRLAPLERLAQPQRLADRSVDVRRALPPAERGHDDGPDHHPRRLALADRGEGVAAQALGFRGRARGRAGGRRRG